jgi:nucleoside-diphosphate-sugar epimerase
VKIFVTGATGFVGSHFLNAALAADHEVIALRRPHSRSRVPLLREPQWLEKSLADIGFVDFAGCEALVHLAAQGVTPQPATWDDCFRFNVVETLQLVEMATHAGLHRVVVSGSYAEYGRAGLRFDPIPPDAPLEPADPYAASKAAASIALAALCRVKKFELVYYRLFSVFGEGQFEGNFWPQLRRAALDGKDFPMTTGTQVRDFIPVEAVAAKLLSACTRTDVERGRPLVLNLASGKPVSLREIAGTWWKQFEAKGQLLVGAVPTRPNEVERYVPLVTES